MTPPHFKFKLGNQKNVTTNWKELVDLLKKSHNNKEPVKDKHVEFKATTFNKFLFLEGIHNNRVKT